MNLSTSIVSRPPLNPPLSWLTMTFSPLSSVILQYAPALGSVTHRPTLAMAASSRCASRLMSRARRRGGAGHQ
jgi:hypothetical protein